MQLLGKCSSLSTQLSIYKKEPSELAFYLRVYASIIIVVSAQVKFISRVNDYRERHLADISDKSDTKLMEPH